MLDLTKEIQLAEKNRSRYQRLQLLFYVFCLSLVLFLTYRILFPTQEFNYSFVSLNKGVAVNPRDEKGKLITEGVFPSQKKTYFDSTLAGTYSEIKVAFTPQKNSSLPENEKLFLRKSYKAFLLPEGTPIGFRDGTLLKNNSNYYLISDKKLRKFDKETFLALGFSQTDLLDISDEELKLNPRGEDISDAKSYPADSLFKIEKDYYILNSAGFLEKFISPKAFTNQYSEEAAIKKNVDFFEQFPLAENQIGFSDGSLLSFGNSVYIASGKKLYPIGDPTIFINQGFDWKDIININGDEFSFYEKERMFNLSSAHPDGTIFFANDTLEYYIIKDNQKHRLLSEKVATSWIRKKPIAVLEKSLDTLADCKLEKSFWGKTVCRITLDQTKNYPGIYYEFSLTPKNNFALDNLNIRYEKNITLENMRSSIGSMLLRIKTRYGIQNTP